MTIRIAVILIILTLIFAVIFFYFLNQNSRITELIVTQDPLNTLKNEKIFTDNDKNIFLLIGLSKVKKGEKITVSWFRYVDNTRKELIQDNNISLESKGSGFIKISLLNKNGSYENGIYDITVSIDTRLERSLDFSIE